MQMNSYLLFNGQCENAFKFYAKGLGGKIEAMIPHEGTPAADRCRRSGAARSCMPA